jgi:aspartate/tyrosine/aromatic aminotransferase
MGLFDQLSLLPPDPILGLTAAFNADPRKTKVNLSVGLFKTEELKTPILKSVKRAEALLLEEQHSKEYLSIEGDRGYIQQVGALVFGQPFWSRSSEQIVGVQTVGGTSALKIGGDLLKREIGKELYISEPTWPNHRGVFSHCGMRVQNYPYYDIKKNALDLDQLYSFLADLSAGSIVVLQPSCHNPTGADPSLAEWRKLSALFLEKRLIPFFDFAYQGFDEGVEQDAKAIRLFVQEGHEMFVATSHSKNFGLYAERVGALFIVTHSKLAAEKTLSQIKVAIRTNYSNPPLHGASIVYKILSTPSLRKEWEEELTGMRERIIKMRGLFTEALVAGSRNKEFRFLKERKGLFSFCGLTESQVDRIRSEDAIYMTGDGRINVAGLNRDNLDYVVKSILKNETR